MPGPTAIFLLTCPDQRGIVAAVSDFLYRHNGNIVHADQHTDQQESLFLQRVEFELDGFDLDRAEIVSAFAPLAERFGMRWDVRFSDDVARVALLVSKQAHCMYDLLARREIGELRAKIPLVVSNHPDHGEAAQRFGAAFHHLPVTPETKAAQEEALAGLLADHDIDLVVLARYMQILSPGFVAGFPERIINIHHSFLPAFAGGRPYHQAYQRGVKVIGATAHYVTAELDEGPIIHQDVVGVSHRDSVDDLIHKGRDLEMVVLARAVSLHLAHKVLVYRNKTVVFG